MLTGCLFLFSVIVMAFMFLSFACLLCRFIGVVLFTILHFAQFSSHSLPFSSSHYSYFDVSTSSLQTPPLTLYPQMHSLPIPCSTYVYFSSLYQQNTTTLSCLYNSTAFSPTLIVISCSKTH